MQLHLYSAEYLCQFEPRYLSLLIDQLPKHIQEKALRYHRWQDVYGFVIGKHLLRIALKQMQFSDDLNGLQYTLNHKPFLLDGPYFNISHSGNRVVCLISQEKNVGIDIEYINKEFQPDDFKTQFTLSEWSAIRSSQDPTKKFYEFWTAKESIVKADGRGLTIPLDLIEINERQTAQLDGKVWNFFPLSYFAGYACHFAIEDIKAENAGLVETGPMNVDIVFFEVTPADIISMSD
ncbi:MAG TPA: 4'-phosphopantetheinyl transferase superfamily protein [Niastella sp.]